MPWSSFNGMFPVGISSFPIFVKLQLLPVHFVHPKGTKEPDDAEGRSLTPYMKAIPIMKIMVGVDCDIATRQISRNTLIVKAARTIPAVRCCINPIKFLVGCHTEVNTAPSNMTTAGVASHKKSIHLLNFLELDSGRRRDSGSSANRRSSSTALSRHGQQRGRGGGGCLDSGDESASSESGYAHQRRLPYRPMRRRARAGDDCHGCVHVYGPLPLAGLAVSGSKCAPGSIDVSQGMLARQCGL